MKSFGQVWRRERRAPQCSVLNGIRGQSWANASYGIADYLVIPIGMLLAAPFLLRHLGSAQYGVWVLAGAAVSTGGVVSGGFGDAAIKFVGDCRGRKDWKGVVRIVRSMITINLVQGGGLAIMLWYLAPFITRRIVKVDVELQTICAESLRIGSGLLVVRSIESIFISTLRAFESYGATTRISICSRITTLIGAVALTRSGRNVVWIMSVTLFVSTLGTLAQAIALRMKIGSFSPTPSLQRRTLSDIVGFGGFSWLQAISGVVFSHADRFIVGFFMGAPAVAYYSLCIQAAQPIHGLSSSGLHFLFPHLSSRLLIAPLAEIRRKVTIAFIINIALIAAMSLPLSVFGSRILSEWIGPAFAGEPWMVFPTIVWSFALLGMNVTAHYALLALGQVRVVTYLNLLAGILMLLSMTSSIPRYGLHGAASSRLIYGPITCLAYLYLFKIVWRGSPHIALPATSIYTVFTESAE